MTVQLPYNPESYPPGHTPIPVWLPSPHAYFPPTFQVQGSSKAQVLRDPICRPPRLYFPPVNKTFHLFPLLPPELRLRVWSFAVPTDRVIEIRSWGSGPYAPIKITVHPHRLPTIFCVCKESRSEARRIYKVVEIGTSVAIRQESRTYVPWKYHPINPAADPSFTTGTAPMPYAEPHPAAKVRISWAHDIIYLGPEFRLDHVLQFFTASGSAQELKGLQRLALGHKFWARSDVTLCKCLYSLKSRPDFSEVMIVPDDERNALADRWYYGKHEIKLLQPEGKFQSRPDNGDVSRDFVKNLQEWFVRLWKDLPLASELAPSILSTEIHPHDEIDQHDGDNSSVGTLVDEAEDRMGRRPPIITVKSIRRDGCEMSGFNDGLWRIQDSIGDMWAWKTWTPQDPL